MEKWYKTLPVYWKDFLLKKMAHPVKTINKGLIETNLLSLSYGKIIRKDIDTYEGLLPESFETYQIVEVGDIILRLTDLQNDKRSLRVGYCSEKGIITSAYLCLRPYRNVFPKFLFYLLHTVDLLKVFYFMGGGVRQNLRFEELRYLWLPVPPFEEQRAIAEYLDREVSRMDRIVELLTAQQERYDQLKRSLISEVISKGLPHHNPSTFRSLRLKDIATFISGYAFKSSSFNEGGDRPVVKIADIKSNIEYDDCDKVHYSPEYHKAIIKKGDILIAMSGATFGKACMIKDSKGAYLNQRVGIVRSKSNSFLFYHILSAYFKDYLQLRDTSSAQPNVSGTDIMEYSLLLPNKEEQSEIVEYLDERCGRIDRISELIGRKIELMESLKKSLIEEVVTGQRCVLN